MVKQKLGDGTKRVGQLRVILADVEVGERLAGLERGKVAFVEMRILADQKIQFAVSVLKERSDWRSTCGDNLPDGTCPQSYQAACCGHNHTAVRHVSHPPHSMLYPRTPTLFLHARSEERTPSGMDMKSGALS